MHRRLKNFKVEGLFGLYRHDIALNQDKHVTAIIGPNGVGKTLCLRMIDALFNKKYNLFLLIPFGACTYAFSDGLEIKISKEISTSKESAHKTKLTFQLTKDGQAPITWRPFDKLEKENARLRNVRLNFAREVELLSAMEVEVFVDHLRNPFQTERDRAFQSEEAEVFSNLLEGSKCHLIEAQRLLVIPEAEDRSGNKATVLAVDQKSKTLSQRIKAVLTQYAALSQSLDRSFPHRILHGRKLPVADPNTIEGDLSQLEARRRALEAVGILEPETESVTEVPRKMTDDVQKVFSVYIADTNKKLDVFSGLQRKIQLFESLIKERFVSKSISIDKEKGFTVTSFSGNKISLNSLSSGEQHQLVLIFELLFETETGDLVLIDEPELSLHVAWQRKFVDDLLKIIEANPFDAILATHSPVLIGHHFDLAVELKGHDGEQVD